MNDTTYHNDTTRVSKSGLDLIRKSPAQFYHHYYVHRADDTDAMRIGRNIHTRIFEPDIYWSSVHNDIKHAEQVQLNAMAKSVRNHPAAKLLLQSGVAESVHLWTDLITQVDCKLKADWLTTDGSIVVDLKSCNDCSPMSFKRSAMRYRYDVQAAFYLDGLSHTNARDVFVFIAVEKTYPYKVAVYEAPDSMVSSGRDKYLADLHLLAECRRNNEWPAYDNARIQLLPWS